MKGTVAACALLSAVACSSASIEGGSLREPGAPPSGERIGAFGERDCRAANGRTVEPERVRVTLWKEPGGTVRLVEERPGSDPLVSDNVSGTPPAFTFYVTLESEDGPAMLREYRFPSDAARPGTFAIAENFSVAPSGTPRGFVGRYARAVLACSLVPEAEGASGLVPSEPSSIVPPP